MKTVFCFRIYYIWWLLIILTILHITFWYKWRWFCTNFDSARRVNELCKMYKNGYAEGTICSPLCDSKEVTTISCQTGHTTKEAVFSSVWKNTKIMFKSALTTFPNVHWYDNGVLKYPNEKEFISTIITVTKNMLNQTLPISIINKLAFLGLTNKQNDVRQRQIEMDNIWKLIQDNEYLLSQIYSDRACFPQIVGTCGYFYAVEYVNPIPDTSSIFFDTDTKDNWMKNLKYAISIMELLEELDNFVEPLYMCNMKLSDLGMTHIENGRTRILDLDHIFPKSMIDRYISELGRCERDEDCVYYDCRGKCNNKLKKCENGVNNNNLQIACEKIFLGWRVPQTLLIPGLLLSQHAPVDLLIILRLCSNPNDEIGIPKSSANDEIRKRLYSVLVDIDQAYDNVDY